MEFLARAGMLFQTWQRNSIEKTLDRALSEQDAPAFAAASRLALTRPDGVELLTPNRVEQGTSLLHENGTGADFLHLVAGVAHQPYRLMKVDRYEIEDGLIHAVSHGHTGSNLATAIYGIGIDPQSHAAIRRGLNTGIHNLFRNTDLETTEIADALSAISYGPLAQNAHCHQAVCQGVASGVAELAATDRIGTITEIYNTISSCAPVARGQRTPYYPAFAKGLSDYLNTTATEYPHDIRSILGELRTAPDLLEALTTTHVQTATRSILKNHNEERAEIANFNRDIADIPHLAFALKTMPESNRMVMFAADQTGSNYPMIVESTPRQGIRITTGCSINHTPEERISAWMEHEEYSRRETTIPLVFEGIARLAQSPYKQHAAAAGAQLDILSVMYKSIWAEQLPEIARSRIEKVLPPAPAAA